LDPGNRIIRLSYSGCCSLRGCSGGTAQPSSCAADRAEDAADDAAYRGGKKVEHYKGGQRPGGQSVPARGRFFRFSGQTTRGESADKGCDDARDRPPECCNNREGTRFGIVTGHRVEGCC